MKFGGGDKCATCGKSVYANEKIAFERKAYHTKCFLCSICAMKMNDASKAGGMDGKIFHRRCFETQFRTSGGKFGGKKVGDPQSEEAALTAKPGDRGDEKAAAHKGGTVAQASRPSQSDENDFELIDLPGELQQPRDIFILHRTLYGAKACSRLKDLLASSSSSVSVSALALQPDDQGRTPLHHAALLRDAPLIEALLALDPTAAGVPDRSGCLPLHTALGPAARVRRTAERAVAAGECPVELGSLSIAMFWCDTCGRFVSVCPSCASLCHKGHSLRAVTAQTHGEPTARRCLCGDGNCCKNKIAATTQHAADKQLGLEAIKILLAATGDHIGQKTNEEQSIVHLAAEGGDVEILKLVIAAYKPPPVSAFSACPLAPALWPFLDANGDSPLHLLTHLAEPGCVPLLAELLDAGLPPGTGIQTLDTHGRTPLLACAFNGCLRHTLAELLALSTKLSTKLAEESVKATDEDGCTLLHAVCSSGSSEALELVLTHFKAGEVGACRQRTTPLGNAARNKRLRLADFKLLLAFDTDAVRSRDSSGRLPLHCAMKQAADVVQLLLDADPSAAKAVDDWGSLPLHLAAAQGNLEALKLLVKAFPAALDVVDNNGDLPVHRLQGRAGSAAVALLAPSQQQAQTRNYALQLPLHCLCNGDGDLASVLALLDAFPDAVKAQDAAGLLPLHVAAQSAGVGVVDALVKRFPEALLIEDNTQQVPVHKAVMSGTTSTPLLALLLNPATARVTDGRVRLPLQYLAAGTTEEVVAQLLEANPDGVRGVSVQDRYTALHVAATSGSSLGAVSLLLKAFPDALGLLSEKEEMPLHLALKEGVADVAFALLDAYPAAARHETEAWSLPLHLAVKGGCCAGLVEALLNLYPNAARERNGDYEFPLHMLQSSTPVAVVRLLLEAFPEAIGEANKTGQLPLHLAIEEGSSRDVIALLLAKGLAADLDPLHAACYDDKTALHYAAQRDSVWLVEMLLEAYASAEAVTQALLTADKMGNKPIHFAVGRGGSSAVLRLLLHRLPESYLEVGPLGKLPLHLAAETGNADAVELLLKFDTENVCSSTSDHSQSLPLHYAAWKCRRSTLLLLKAFPEGAAHANASARLPLHEAARRSDTALQAVYEANKEGATARDKENNTVLHVLCDSGSTGPEELKLILEAYPEAALLTNKDACLPLHLYCDNSSCNAKILLALLEATKSVLPRNPRDKDGKTVIASAVSRNTPAVVDLILQHTGAASVLVVDKEGKTALHYAVDYGSSHHVVKMLVERCPEAATLLCKDKQSPLAYAISNSACVQTIQLLLDTHPPAMHLKDKEGKTILHLQANQRVRDGINPTLVSLLIDGSDADTFLEIDEDGNTPLHTALENCKHRGFALALIEKAPAALKVKNKEGKLPMHYMQEDPVVCRAVVEGYPDALTMPDHDAALPLFRACSEAAHEAVLEILLAGNPQAVKVKASGRDGRLPLHAIAEYGNYKAVELILAADPDAATVKDDDGALPLHFLCQNSSTGLKAMQLLLQANPEAGRARNKDQDLALHTLCDYGYERPLSVFERLLAAYPEAAAAKNKEGELPMHKLIGNSRVTPGIVKFLMAAFPGAVKHTDNEGNLPLHKAVGQVPLVVVELLVNADPQALRLKNKSDAIPLHIACTEGKMELLPLMLSKYPQGVMEKDREGRVPLHLACAQSYVYGSTLELYKQLLKVDASAASQVDCDGNLPIHLFAKQADNSTSPAIIKALLKASPDSLTVKNGDGQLPLHALAAETCPYAVLQLILQGNPAAAKERDSEDSLPLHLFCKEEQELPAMAAMVEANEDALQAEDEGGQLPLHILCSSSDTHLALVQLMLARHAEAASKPDRYGNLALHLAAESESSAEVIEALLAAYPDGAKQVNDEGKLPLHIAAGKTAGWRNSSQDVAVKVLLKAYPDGAQMKTSKGRLPLHESVANEDSQQAPLATVMALLAAYPEAAQEKTQEGQYPAHLASAGRWSSKPDPEVLEALAKSYLAAFTIQDGEGNTPLHVLCGTEPTWESFRTVFAAFPKAAEMTSLEGALPLHAAVQGETSTRVVKALLKAFPEGAKQKNKEGALPLHLAVSDRNCLTPTVQALVDAYPESVRVKDKDGAMALHHAAERDAKPAVIRLLLQVYPQAAHEKTKRRRNTPLHLACSYGSTAGLIQLLLEAYPHAVQERDSYGRLPLNLAAADASADAVTLVLAAYPQAAKEKDDEGRLPVSFAMEMAWPDTLVRQFLQYDMPLGTLAEGSKPLEHSFTWPWVLRECEDRYVELVEEILDGPYDAQALADVLDDTQRSAVDVCTPKCKKSIITRLYFHGRYKLEKGPVAHRSATCVVVFATDSEDEDRPVALKFMRIREQYEREVAVREESKLDSEFIIDTIRHHDGDADAGFKSETMRKGFKEYPFCIVMPLGERNLMDALLHEHFAGEDWPLIRVQALQLAQALEHLHDNGLIHADIKPLNAMRLGSKLKLIDLDACVSYRNKEKVGAKSSSAFCPPELVYVDDDGVASIRSYAPPTDGSAASQEPPPYELVNAHPSFDMWSFGCVMFHLCTGMSLWHSNHEDNLDQDDLRRLSTWSNELKGTKLKKVKDKVAKNLLSRLLQKNPLQRPDTMARVLAHPFFSGKDAARMPGEAPEYDVFLSYRVWSDSAHVETLYQHLVDKGLRVWWDKMCLKPGVSWEKGFAEGLVKSHAFVPVMSRDALKSMASLTADARCDNVLLEYRLAMELRALGLLEYIHPVMLGDEKDGTFGHFFENGCFPDVSDVVVESVEAKVVEHLDLQGLGAPLKPNTTAKACLAEMTSNQGAFVQGPATKAWAEVADKIKLIETGGKYATPAENTGHAAAEYDKDQQEFVIVNLKSELANLRRQLTRVKSMAGGGV